MLRFLDCFKFEQPEPAPTVHAGWVKRAVRARARLRLASFEAEGRAGGPQKQGRRVCHGFRPGRLLLTHAPPTMPLPVTGTSAKSALRGIARLP